MPKEKESLMKSFSLPVIALLVSMFIVVVHPGVSLGNASKLSEAATVLQEIQSIPEGGIPPHLFHDAQGIAIIPNLVKVGVIVGARYGSGFLSANNGGIWSGPVFITLSGGSFGFQIGAEVTDIILVFKTRRSMEAFKMGRFTLGANISVAAGPVGRHAEAATDLQLSAEIYSYSRSRGLFAGVALEGAALAFDNDANSDFYGRSVNADEILLGTVVPPPAGAHFSQLLQQFSGSPNRY